MRQRVTNHLIALLFIVAFLVPRIANAHALSHLSEDEDPVSCEICDIIATSNQVNLIGNDTPTFEESLKNVPSSHIVFVQFKAPLVKIASPRFIYNKPPPLL